MGSPPRGRGKACQEVPRCAVTRITPAWAGKSCQSAAESAPGWDHPRVGGEKCPLVSLAIFGWGSPPRGRGKGTAAFHAWLCCRITPAWAGKSSGFAPCSPSSKDHPRVGGEKPFPPRSADLYRGSPPRGRGKEECHSWETAYQGITPAWAGKRLSAAAFAFASWDHPRVGGEKSEIRT